MYEFLTEGQHMITVRNRDGLTHQHRFWNNNVIYKILQNQLTTEDVFITKYPKGKLIKYIILDFDSKEDKDIALADATRMMNFFEDEGHPCVLVDSSNKGYHLYIKISPFLFKNEGNRKLKNWDSFFNEFVRYMIRRSSNKPYTTLDGINTNAGMKGNIRLIGSLHPSTQGIVQIVKGEFSDEPLPPTHLQDLAQKVAYNYCEICDEYVARQTVKTQVVNGGDPIEENDLREVFPAIFGGEIKHYDHYSMMCCPFHMEKNPSLSLTKRTYKCLACGEKGNIWTLKKKGLVEFGINGEVTY